MRVSEAASLSAISPVPSGLLSSTIRMSAGGADALTRVTISSRLSRSLYVGIITATGPSGAVSRSEDVNLSCLDTTLFFEFKLQRCRDAGGFPDPLAGRAHH